jgi:hypothetical protein
MGNANSQIHQKINSSTFLSLMEIVELREQKQRIGYHNITYPISSNEEINQPSINNHTLETSFSKQN